MLEKEMTPETTCCWLFDNFLTWLAIVVEENSIGSMSFGRPIKTNFSSISRPTIFRLKRRFFCSISAGIPEASIGFINSSTKIPGSDPPEPIVNRLVPFRSARTTIDAKFLISALAFPT